MNKKLKYILGIAALVVFATIATIVIIKHNEKVAHAQEEEVIEEEAEEEPASDSSTEAQTTVKSNPGNETHTAVDEGFTEEEIALMDSFEPAGADHYEIDEEPPAYHVFINNYEEIYTHYDDFKICNELPYYLHTYFNLCTGNLNEMYEVTITEGSCVTDEYSSLVTFEATVDKYPGMTIYIEYDKNYREFGIKSSLGDYSLEVLKKDGNYIPYDPSLEVEGEEENQAPNSQATQP